MSEMPRTDAVEYMAVEPYREKSLLEFFRDLERQVSALKADAERYQYLRRNLPSVAERWNLTRLAAGLTAGDEEIDAAIDSERADKDAGMGKNGL